MFIRRCTMCLAIPGRIVSIDGDCGRIDFGGASKEVSLAFVADEAAVGDWVLIHTGFALSIISEEEARDTLEAIDAAFHIEEL